MKKLLNEIDELLCHLENFTHGKDGNDITEMRYRIREALRQPNVIKSVCDHIDEKSGLICIGGRCNKCNEIV